MPAPDGDGTSDWSAPKGLPSNPLAPFEQMFQKRLKAECLPLLDYGGSVYVTAFLDDAGERRAVTVPEVSEALSACVETVARGSWIAGEMAWGYLDRRPGDFPVPDEVRERLAACCAAEGVMAITAGVRIDSNGGELVPLEFDEASSATAACAADAVRGLRSDKPLFRDVTTYCTCGR